MTTKDIKDSSLISRARYNEKEKELEITFLGGKRYLYYSVSSEAWEEFDRAESAGSHFSKHIKGKYNYKQL